MVSRIVRATLNLQKSALLLTCVVGLSLAVTSAHAQDDNTPPPTPPKVKKAKKKVQKAAAPAADAAPATDSPSLVKAGGGESNSAPSGENLKFNTESAPSSTDRHEPMVFKDSGEAPLGTPRPEYAETAPEDTPYKAYIGYPKNQFGVYAQPMTLASSWSYGANTYNFTTSATAIGAMYRLFMTPMWSMEVDYSHYSMSMSQDTVKTLTFNSSTIGFDNYYIRNRFCVIGKSTFYRQLCPGFDVGNDGYPIVNFVSNTNLALARVQDIILGLNLTYQEPFSEKLMFKVMAGYNYGTGIGNSGYLTSKNNSSYYLNGGVEWTITEHNIVSGTAEYKNRDAKVSGVKGNTTDTWETKSSTVGGKFAYIRSF